MWDAREAMRRAAASCIPAMMLRLGASKVTHGFLSFPFFFKQNFKEKTEMAGLCICWGAGCARCVRLSHEWQQTRADWSDDDESDSGSEAYTQRFVANAAAYQGTCAACLGAGCGQCVRLSCGWESTMHVHLVAATRAVRSTCQCWGAGWCARCMRSAPPATGAQAISRPAESALAVLADGDDANDAVDEEERVMIAGVSACGADGSCQLSGTSEVLRYDEDNDLYSQGGHTHDDSVDALAGCCVTRPRRQQADGRAISIANSWHAVSRQMVEQLA